MARSTRLFQRAGSPLIQGNSRLHRPYAPSVVIGFVVSVLVPIVYVFVSRVWVGEAASDALSAVFSEWGSRAPGLLIGAAVGSAVGASVGRAWGARRTWITASVFGLAASVAGAFVYATLAG